MDLSGKIIAILPASSGVSARTGNPWMSQEYVLEVPGQYPRRMMFRVFGEDRIKMYNIQPGEDVTVQFDIDAQEYQGRWYNRINAFNVYRGQPAQDVPAAATIQGEAPQTAASPFPPVQPAAPQTANPSFPPEQGAAEGESNDDLPF
ncbi:MAG: DUF3127 domain-containing protein [Prevotella sp.]|nr:DUF3127 domain-containing protein [Prevotella sp.]